MHHLNSSQSTARISLLAVVAAAIAVAACSPSTTPAASCTTSATCAPDETCRDGLCIKASTPCFPSCDPGFACISAQCVASTCVPECKANQECDLTTVTCKDVTVPSVEITSPASGVYAGTQLQATATARAPGGVSGVRFEVRKVDGTTVIGTAEGVAVPAGSANYAATVLLNGAAVTDGDAKLFAVLSYPTNQTKESVALPIKIDRSAPVIAPGTVTVPAAWLGPANATATVTAVVTDEGAGVQASSVKLALVGVTPAKSYVGVAGAGNVYSFAVPVADLGVAAGTSASVAFTLEAADHVGNALAPQTNGAYSLRADLKKPVLALVADSSWHLASAAVAVNGTVTENESGTQGGAAGVKLTPGTVATPGTPIVDGTFPSTSTFAATFAVGGQSVAEGTEEALPFFVTVTDNAGNAETAVGALNIDNRGPQVSAVAVTTAADATGAGGRKFYKATGTDLNVTATIADASGVVTPCLKTVGAGGVLGACIAGVAGAAHSYGFALPRSVGTGKDGSVPVQFVITAEDGLARASGISGAEQARHQTQSAAADVYFDTVAPVVAALAVDAAWYPKKAGGTGANYTLPVTVSFTDAGAGINTTNTGVLAGTLIAGAQTVSSTSCTATSCTFDLPTSAATAGAELPRLFTVSVADLLANVSDPQSGSRNIDDKAPTLTSVTADATWYGPGSSLPVTAVFADAGAGLLASTVKLRVGTQTFTGTAGAGGSVVFSLAANSLVTDGNADSAIGFTFEAADAAGNAVTGLTNVNAVRKVDRKPPVLTPTVNSAWHLASETVHIVGSAAEGDSGLTGGLAAAKVNPGSSLSATGQVTGAFTGSNYDVPFALTGLNLSGVEGPQPLFLAVTDAAGNLATSAVSLNVDDKAPLIETIALTTAADFTRVSDSRKFYKAGAGTLTVTAKLTDASGIVSPCLKVLSGGTPGACVAGSPAARRHSYTFLLPRSAGAGQDGSAPVQFVITSNDGLTASAAGGEVARHQAQSAAQDVYFDDVAPVITLSADAKTYAKYTSAVRNATFSLTVTATVTDAGAGVSPSNATLVPTVGTGSAGTPITATLCTPTGATTASCTYSLPSNLAADGVEGAANTISLVAHALDNVTNTGASAAGTRKFDDLAPTVTSYKVWKSTASKPGSTGVTAPALVNGTGYDGTTFIYNDSVSLEVTLSDGGAGILPGALKIKVGDANAVAQNPDTSGCASGAPACTVTLTLALNDRAKTGDFTAATWSGDDVGGGAGERRGGGGRWDHDGAEHAGERGADGDQGHAVLVEQAAHGQRVGHRHPSGRRGGCDGHCRSYARLGVQAVSGRHPERRQRGQRDPLAEGRELRRGPQRPRGHQGRAGRRCCGIGQRVCRDFGEGCRRIQPD